MRRIWTDEMVCKLRSEYKDTPMDILAFKLGVTVSALKSKARKLGMKRRNYRWKPQEDNLLRQVYTNMTMREIRPLFDGRSESCIYQRAKILGLEKSPELLSQHGHRISNHPKSIASRFKPGHTPANKGRRQTEYMTEESINRTTATRFKKGQRPHNVRPIGWERTDQGGYILVKVADRPKMVHKHRYIWEQHHGAIPDGMCVAFKDGNKQNCNIDNLMLITNAEKATRITSAMSAEQRKQRIERAQATRNETIRKDKIRIHFGLEPKTKLVKRW